MIPFISVPMYWKPSTQAWLEIGILMMLIAFIFQDGIEYVFGKWLGMEEYSHGLLIPFIAGFLVWRQKHDLARTPWRGSWRGLLVIALGLAIYFLGELSTLYIIIQYALPVVLYGVALATGGTAFARRFRIPLLFLLLAIPLPNFLYQELSAQLQLISSQLGVSLIRACAISVYLEGNVIDLGSYQLQVAEACSGLRYLFPLVTLACIGAYLYQGRFWQRAIIVLSSIPISVVMNSLRIGVIGILVEYWGPQAAEGFLHDAEGWIMFMLCTGLLLAEIAWLARIDPPGRGLREALALDWPPPLTGRPIRLQTPPMQLRAAGVLLAAAALLSQALAGRTEYLPGRADFVGFPLQLGAWRGERQVLDPRYVKTLKFDDYLLADYTLGDANTPPVNLYSAYYASQRKGESAHSPRSCIPGDGWRIESLETRILPLALHHAPLRVNRVLIQKGATRQLVYYWFQQRGRDLTDEYRVKWFLFWDALTRNRTDGALVRLVTYIPDTEEPARAEQRLVSFLGAMLPALDRYIPQ